MPMNSLSVRTEYRIQKYEHVKKYTFKGVKNWLYHTAEDQQPRLRGAFPTSKANGKAPWGRGWVRLAMRGFSISSRNVTGTFLDYELCFKFV